MLSPVLRFIAAISITMLLTHSAAAQLVPPEGWSIQVRDGIAVIASPPDDRGDQIAYFIDTAERVESQPDANDQRFTALTREHAERLGTMTWHQGITREGSLLKDAVTITGDDGAIIHGLSFAYPTAQGLQTLSVYWPDPLTSADSRVATVLDHVANLWRSGAAFDGQVLSPSSPQTSFPQTPPAQPTPPPSPPPTAAQQTHPDPSTWSSLQTEKALTFTHPCTPDGVQVALALMPAWSIGTQTLESWFNTQINSLLQGWTSSGLRPSPPQSVDGASRTASYAFKIADGSSWTAWFRAVQRGDRAQMAAVLAPAGLGLSDTRVSAALNHVRTLYAQGYTLLPEQTAYASGPNSAAASLDFNNAGATITGVLTASNAQHFASGYFSNAPEAYTLFSNGRAFKTFNGIVDDSSPRGTWQQTPSGYALDWPALAAREKVAPSCFSNAAPSPAPPKPETNGCVLMPFTIKYPNGGELTLWNKHCG